MVLTTVVTMTAVFTGGITFYPEAAWGGRPLGCDYPQHTYVCDGSESAWMAAPIEWLQSGLFRCGDRVKIIFKSGRELWVRVRDACGGCLRHNIWDTGSAFVADLPDCWRDGEPTATGRIFNLDLLLRLRERMFHRSRYGPL